MIRFITQTIAWSICVGGIYVVFPTTLTGQDSPAVGTWQGTAETDDGTLNYRWTIKPSEKSLTGFITSDDSGATHEFKKVDVDGKQLNFSFDYEIDSESIEIKVTTQINENKQNGTWTAIDSTGSEVASGKVAAERVKKIGLAGQWNATVSTDEGERHFGWTFTKENGSFTGNIANNADGSKHELKNVKLDGNQLMFDVLMEIDGESLSIKVESEISDGKQDGTWIAFDGSGNEVGSGSVAAEKVQESSALAGDWSTVAVLPDGQELKSVLSLKGKNNSLSGTLTGLQKTTKLDDVTWKGKALRIAFEFELESLSRKVVIEATMDATDSLSGVWILKGESGGEEAKGDWSATRNR